MSQPFFSICIPNFNYANFIGETIDSVLNQTYQDFEIIITDNASTDESWNVIIGYVEKDNRIHAFRNRYNIGFAPNLQRASEKAVGRYMILLSSDDVMYPDALQEYFNIIEKREDKDALVLFSAQDTIDQDGNLVQINYRKQKEYFPSYLLAKESDTVVFDGRLDISKGHDVLKASLLSAINPASFAATCYSRNLWEQVEGYDTTYVFSPDAAFLYKLLGMNPTFIYVHKRLFGYRIHNQNQVAVANKQDAFKLQLDQYNRVISFPQDVLNVIGINRDQLKNVFIKNICIQYALRSIWHGNYLGAFRLQCFSLFTFPSMSIRFGKFYLIWVLIFTFPISYLVIKFSKIVLKMLTSS